MDIIMTLLKGEYPKLKGQTCAWCNSPIRHVNVDPNNGTLELGPRGTHFYVHQMCATSWASVHMPRSMAQVKQLIED
jgi:hypothetical protein